MSRLTPLLLLFVAVLCAFGCGGSGSNNPPPSGTRWALTPAGGVFQTGSVHLTVPAGAVATNTTVTVTALGTTPTPPAGTAYVAGSGWTFTPATFTTPAALRISFAEGAVPANAMASLKVYRRADGDANWTPITTTVDAEARTATASISAFSSYGLFYTPVEGWSWTTAGGAFTFEGLTINLPEGSIATPMQVQPQRTPTPYAAPAGWAYVPNTSYDLNSNIQDFHATNPFNVTIAYAAVDVPAVQRQDVRIFTKANADAPWTTITTTADVAGLKGTAPSGMLGTFALFVPVPPSPAYYVEEKDVAQSDNTELWVYGTSPSGEAVLYMAIRDHNNRLVQTSYRNDDKSFLGFDPTGGTLHATLLSAENWSVTRIRDISPESGWTYQSVGLMRSTRRGAARDIVIWTQEENTAHTAARDRLILYRNGAEPVVLRSIPRAPSSSPAVLRGVDIDSDGDVLALTEEGLVIFEGTTPRLLVSSELLPQDAQVSPSGAKVLFRQLGGETGWKIMDMAGVDVVATVPGVGVSNIVRWGTDDGHLLVTFDDPKAVKSQELLDGTFATLVTPPVRAGSNFVDLGPRS